MAIFKYICFLFLSTLTFTTVAQQNSASFSIEWLGFNATQQLRDGSYVTYPMAKDAIINEEGNLVLQKDISLLKLNLL